ncbi:high-affinity iron transporter [Fictibacillus solisalsi]|uniref:High-affinity iron transporter n=1 Tax=Fictibacillus solisalsi TaxID=459525 RepID=A0A1G9WIX8_9BACL|nr:FTR1 family protein [Fictibacillus solisalsi]SDM84542.1 high-affinity iron transporter [Fictibacillus solisalsi]
MKPRNLSIIIVVLFLLLINLPIEATGQESNTHAKVSQTIPYIDASIKSVKQMDFNQAETSFNSFKEMWNRTEGEVRKENLMGYSKIKTKMAAVSVALLNEDQKKSEESLQMLKVLLKQFKEGQLSGSTRKAASKNVSITVYLQKIKEVKQSLRAGDQSQAKAQVNELNSLWLSVEGNVVGQSQKVYNNSERRLVLLASSINNPGDNKRSKEMLDDMEKDLTPLAHTSYGVWDAALIPLREGLEALLVVGALLSFIKRRKDKKGSLYIWSGTLAGVAASLGIGFLVSYVLSSSAFGQNNFLINGWSGVIASLMLLYVSYWLHRNANVNRWNSFMKTETERLVSGGKLLSLGILAFLAVLREGIETVIFLIGMANQMSHTSLILGILLGFGILAVIGICILKFSVHVPLKPFFIVSSLIVFYLCLKFMGSGIHSLQLSGLIPATTAEYIPTIQLFSVYPSLYSTMPQIVVVGIALIVIITQQIKKRNNQNRQQEAS